MTTTNYERHRLLGRLFRPDNSEPGPLKFLVRAGCEEEAASTWAQHGVCLECSTRSITVGRCIQCGWKSEGVIAREAQYAKDHRCIRCGGGPANELVHTADMSDALEVEVGKKICEKCLFSILY